MANEYDSIALFTLLWVVYINFIALRAHHREDNKDEQDGENKKGAAPVRAEVTVLALRYSMRCKESADWPTPEMYKT